jgi:hypothetical protein
VGDPIVCVSPITAKDSSRSEGRTATARGFRGAQPAARDRKIVVEIKSRNRDIRTALTRAFRHGEFKGLVCSETFVM